MENPQEKQRKFMEKLMEFHGKIQRKIQRKNVKSMENLCEIQEKNPWEKSMGKISNPGKSKEN